MVGGRSKPKETEIFSMTDDPTAWRAIKATCLGRRVSALADTGANRSAISYEFFKTHVQPNGYSLRESRGCKAANKSALEVLGEVTLPFLMEKHQLK